MKVSAGIAAIVIAAQSAAATHWMRRTAPRRPCSACRHHGRRQPSVPTGRSLKESYRVNTGSTATAASAAFLALRKARRLRWRWKTGRTGITPPWTEYEFADFDEWLGVMIEEVELGYSDDAMHLLSETAPAVDYELPPQEPGC